MLQYISMFVLYIWSLPHKAVFMALVVLALVILMVIISIQSKRICANQ